MFKAAVTFLLFSSIAMFAAEEFRDVHMLARDGGKLKEEDGALWLDRREGGMVFISDHKPLALVFYPSIKRMSFDDKNKHTLRISYIDSNQREQFVMFELKDSGNRQALLATLETHSGLQVERIPR